MNHMRKKSPSQGGGFGNNQHRKQRFSGGGGSGGGQSHGGGNRPRKNYTAMREKYLQQARDALASGDRVLAENYFQHADHCFRMIAEENASRPQPRPNSPQEQQASESTSDHNGEEEIDMNNSALPAFLKVSYEQAGQPQGEQPAVQNWEERDQA